MGAPQTADRPPPARRGGQAGHGHRTRRTALTLALALGILGTLHAAPPNFLIVLADDCTFNDLPLYGGQNAKTPHLDALAARGLTFDHAYLCSAMCQPCRAELYTGQFPIRNGCAWNHSACRPETRSLPHFLRPLGYRTGLAGKVHVKRKAAFPFDPVPGFESSCVRDPTSQHELAGISQYMAKDGPFCLVVALVDPHLPWVMGDPSQYPPKKIALPPNIADTPQTREDFAAYLAEITYMDSQVGEILAQLEASGKAPETIVLFSSEQGSQFPGCKWTNWDTGVHTALIAAGPGVPKGKRSPALVQYADVAPTLVHLAGGNPDGESFDGTSFHAALLGKSDHHRQFVYGMHNNLPEGPPYPIRSIGDGTHRYLRNLLPDELYVEKHVMGGGRLNNPYWHTWTGADPLENESAYQLIRRYMRRPHEELYHTSQDPYEMQNLADKPELAQTKETLSAALDAWMRSQGDPGTAVDTKKTLQAARQGNHLHGNKAAPQKTPTPARP